MAVYRVASTLRPLSPGTHTLVETRGFIHTATYQEVACQPTVGRNPNQCNPSQASPLGLLVKDPAMAETAEHLNRKRRSCCFPMRGATMTT